MPQDTGRVISIYYLKKGLLFLPDMGVSVHGACGQYVKRFQEKLWIVNLYVNSANEKFTKTFPGCENAFCWRLLPAF
ncbi:hypothetical protein D5282_13980 [bacterium 1xD8-48]|nr:hypothetical protein [bacterium 1xD8-48]